MTEETIEVSGAVSTATLVEGIEEEYWTELCSRCSMTEVIIKELVKHFQFENFWFIRQPERQGSA